MARLAAAALLLTASGCSEDPNSVAAQAKAGDQKGYISGNGAVERIAVAKRAEPVTLKGDLVGGGTWASESARGTDVVVLNVWGSWCAPCRAEAPDLARVAAQSRRSGVRFVGIDVRDNPAAARAFARRYSVTYPSWDDQDGSVLAQFAGIVPVSAVPSTMVLDAQGVIRARVIGRVDARTLRGLIEDAQKL